MKVAVIGSEGFVGGAMAKRISEVEEVSLVPIDVKKAGSVEYYESELHDTDIAFICVPTPYDPVARDFDYAHVRDVQWRLGTHGFKGVVCLRSTVAPDYFDQPTPTGGRPIDIYHPEFLSAANAYKEFNAPDVHVIGSKYSKKFPGSATELMRDFYEGLGIVVRRRIEGTRKEAAYLKLIHNVYRATRISFLNELYVSTRRSETDWNESADGLNNQIAMMFGARDMGAQYVAVPGPDGKFGFGGACFPKDIAAFIGYLDRIGAPHEILSAVQSVNSKMRLVT